MIFKHIKNNIKVGHKDMSIILISILVILLRIECRSICVGEYCNSHPTPIFISHIEHPTIYHVTLNCNNITTITFQLDPNLISILN